MLCFVLHSQRSIQEELVHVPNVAAFVRGNFTFVRLLMQYGRGVQQRQALKDVLAGPITAVLQRKGLDLSTDPLAVSTGSPKKSDLGSARGIFFLI